MARDTGESTDNDNEEDDMDPKSGLDGMLAYGVQHQGAYFRVTATVKILQNEYEDIASQSDHSIDSLIMLANGGLKGTDAFGGKVRAVMVGEAVAFRHGTLSEVVLGLCPVSLESEFGDKFQLNPITGQDLTRKETVDMLHRHGLLDDDDHSILTDHIPIFSTSIQPGDLIRNRNKASVSRVMTASQRIHSRRGVVKTSLSRGVKARVIRVDDSDKSLFWRCTKNQRKSGWVYANSVEKIFWAGGIDDDDN